MSKYADLYYEVDPWAIIETGFNSNYGQVSESIFSLGNEYMGLRGYFEEGYSGERLQGSYVNGIYERRSIPKSGYKGMLNFTEFMVNTVDWTYMTIECNGCNLDLATASFSSFVRRLDLKNGILTRSFIWHVDQETDLFIIFERFLSMNYSEVGGQKVTFKCYRGEAVVSVISGLDFSNEQATMGRNFWDCDEQYIGSNMCSLRGITKTTKQVINAMCIFSESGIGQSSGEQIVSMRFEYILNQGEIKTLTKIADIVAHKSNNQNPYNRKVRAQGLIQLSYDILKSESATWWEKQWVLSDIEIVGDILNQQGIRFCIFQMHQTLHTADHSAVIGAKGLTGEAYNGNTFWDTEIYCLPFYLFNNSKAGKSILQLRYDTLDEARERAKALDCRGAFYPIATISGHECCDLWQHASLQLQASTAVMYGIWQYVKLTGDRTFLYDKGAEMLVEISRMLASRGDYSATTGGYGFYGVMGPDEFQMMVHNNSYTNFMAQRTLNYTIEVIKEMGEMVPNELELLTRKINLESIELIDWEEKAKKMILRYEVDQQLFEQHEGYFDLPHMDLKSIPVEDFPLYSHWSYERIYRNNMIKQPDVLMFMLLYNTQFSIEELTANFDYYEPRCIHESSLSPSVHSILAAQIGRKKQAYDFFGFATRMDLDNYNRNTTEGLHTTSIAGSWMNIVYGFGGLRSDGEVLILRPSIPNNWESYRFQLQYQGVIIYLLVTQNQTELWTQNGRIEIMLYEEVLELNEDHLIVKIKEII